MLHITDAGAHVPDPRRRGGYRTTCRSRSPCAGQTLVVETEEVQKGGDVLGAVDLEAPASRPTLAKATPGSLRPTAATWWKAAQSRMAHRPARCRCSPCVRRSPAA